MVTVARIATVTGGRRVRPLTTAMVPVAQLGGGRNPAAANTAWPCGSGHVGDPRLVEGAVLRSLDLGDLVGGGHVGRCDDRDRRALRGRHRLGVGDVDDRRVRVTGGDLGQCGLDVGAPRDLRRRQRHVVLLQCLVGRGSTGCVGCAQRDGLGLGEVGQRVDAQGVARLDHDLELVRGEHRRMHLARCRAATSSSIVVRARGSEDVGCRALLDLGDEGGRRPEVEVDGRARVRLLEALAHRGEHLGERRCSRHGDACRSTRRRPWFRSSRWSSRTSCSRRRRPRRRAAHRAVGSCGIDTTSLRTSPG